MKNNQFTVIQYLLYNTDNNRQAYIIKSTYFQRIIQIIKLPSSTHICGYYTSIRKTLETRIQF